MKALARIASIMLTLPIYADEIEIDLSQFGDPIEIPEYGWHTETVLYREVQAFCQNHGAYNAVLINNSARSALNKEGKVIGSEGLGTPVNPQEVLIITRAMVANPVVELYTSIKRLPDCAHTVRILYTESSDRSESSLLGYTIENPKGVYTKLVKYDGKTPWFDWITTSFKNDDGEQGGADQPATVPEPKAEGSEKSQPESEGRSQ